jgi:hypothetical protein
MLGIIQRYLKVQAGHVAEMLFQHDEQRCVVCVAVPWFEDVELSELCDRGERNEVITLRRKPIPA